jgi:HAD superfamily hydrolase (TIGR01509 family)
MSAGDGASRPAALLDIDGTLVDSNYQHALAWYRAFRDHGLTLPLWRVHRSIGMGGDQMIGALAGEEWDAEHGDAARASEKGYYGELIGEVQPLPEARALIETLKERGHTVVLASSAKAEETDHYLDLLGVREIVDGWTTSADVEATKPEPDLVRTAAGRAGAERAVLLGDSTWDFIAAGRAGVAGIGLMTGGFSPEELRAAGATVVFESLGDLLSSLEDTPLG